MTTSEYGEEDAHNSYSLTLPPNSIVNKKCLFCLKHENVPDFDELRLDYFDERDRRISLHIDEIAGIGSRACSSPTSIGCCSRSGSSK